jgi:hypothetical protein
MAWFTLLPVIFILQLLTIIAFRRDVLSVRNMLIFLVLTRRLHPKINKILGLGWFNPKNIQYPTHTQTVGNLRCKCLVLTRISYGVICLSLFFSCKIFYFIGALINEAINYILKNTIKQSRPVDGEYFIL